MRFILPILVIIMLLLFPQRVYCADNINEMKISFVEFGEYDNHWFSYVKMPLNSQMLKSCQAIAATNYLLALDKPNIYPHPSDIHLLDAFYRNGHLSIHIYVPKGSYGGTMLERIYLGQILKTLLNINGVEKVSIIADTPEGLNVRAQTSWYELFAGIIDAPSTAHELK